MNPKRNNQKTSKKVIRILPRRKEYAMDDRTIGKFLSSSQIGDLAINTGDHPYIMPTTYWYSPRNQSIYFHSNVVGRFRSLLEQSENVCFETHLVGQLLPSNIPLEKSIQYESVLVFGKVKVIKNVDDKAKMLRGLLKKYFSEMKEGQDYRPIQPSELKRTSVYQLEISSWSGKKNWHEKADQAPSTVWPSLHKKWFMHYARKK